MTRTTPPSPTELFQRYLLGQADAHTIGLGNAEPVGEVVPHEAVPVQPIDPKQAWDDARAVLAYFPDLPKTTWPVPPEWATLIGSQESTVALPFCLGNTPQLVRNLEPLLTGKLSATTAQPTPSNTAAAAREWATAAREHPQSLLAAAVLRLAGEFDRAAQLLREAPTGCWQAVHANEEAALLWHRGRTSEAAERWQKLTPSVPVLFNRGMAALCDDDRTAAKTALTAAVAGLPETSAWHHLGQLYLTLLV